MNTTMITCIIVDDHEEAIDVLKIHFQHIAVLSLVTSFTSPIEALEYVDKNKIDLIFLDVEMPNFSGLDFLDNLKSKLGSQIPKIIFTTGHHDYAISGFEKGVSDYLLKPVSLSRLKLAIDRLLPSMKNASDSVTANIFFFVESEGKKVRINFDDVIYIEAAGNYVTIATKEKKHTIHGTLTATANLLPEKIFIRSHKSFIVSILSIRSVSGTELVVGFDKMTKNIPIGATYKENVFQKLGIA